MGIIQDRQGVRQLQDIEQKYNLGQMKSNLEIQADTLVKVENELFNTLASLIINLKDLIESQHEVSCWFLFGEPSNTVEPESEWTTTELKDLHIGDLYYDKGSGRIYQYGLIDTVYSWVEKFDTRLIQALSLTNANVTGDERKIYFARPTPPYVNGDWWIQDNGDLWICQITRGTGYYTENDFIVSPLYTKGVNSATANSLTILSGAITTIRQSVDSISSTVSNHIKLISDIDGEIKLIKETYSTVTQTAEDFRLAFISIGDDITDAMGNITKVKTETGFTFNNDGLAIKKDQQEMNTLIDNTGLYVKRNSNVVLEANNEGVIALKMKTDELQIGERCVIMDYENGTGLFHRKV